MLKKLFGKFTRHEAEIYGTLSKEEVKGVASMLRKAVTVALNHEGVKEKTHVDIMLTDNAHIHEINREQRGVDRPTDVLSFPMNELSEGSFDPEVCEVDLDSDKLLLGDMVLNLQRCAQQAEDFGHSYDREISYLTVHSVLHLLGYDHLDEGARKKAMRAREDAIMDVLGL